jgi:hypothetical protein
VLLNHEASQNEEINESMREWDRDGEAVRRGLCRSVHWEQGGGQYTACYATSDVQTHRHAFKQHDRYLRIPIVLAASFPTVLRADASTRFCGDLLLLLLMVLTS